MSDKLILTCSQCLSRNYTIKRKKCSSGKRLEVNKFCKKCNAHTLHKETK